MARNIPKEANPPPAPMRGGASGAPGAVEAATRIAGINDVMPGSPFEREEGPKARRFRVVMGPHIVPGTEGQAYQVMYEGALCRLMKGRVIAENECDLELLRRQGVILEEVDPQPTEAQESPAKLVDGVAVA